MKRFLFFTLVLTTLGLMSCTPSAVGTWVEASDNGTQEHGFILNKDGSAESLNMNYVEFISWEKKGDLLILKGVNTGSVKKEFSDTMKIERITKTDLSLSQAGYTVTYSRK